MEQRIRAIIQRETGIDILEKNRRREYVELRSMYYTILKELNPNYTAARIGKSVNKTREAVLYGLEYYQEIAPKSLEKLKLLITEELNDDYLSEFLLTENRNEILKQIYEEL
jgi:hypothetical protein